MTKTRPSFSADRETMRLVERIADRAMALQHKAEPIQRYKRGKVAMQWHMDILATHNAMPLDLSRLLAADDGEFAHDVFGIRRHLNRDTGQLEDCFVPRHVHRAIVTTGKAGQPANG